MNLTPLQTYISILRGINVGGNRLIKMDQLISLYKSMGLTDCQTYIQSGNVLFRSEPREVNDLASSISEKIVARFQFEVPVIVLTLDELKQIIRENPFADDPSKDPNFQHITILSTLPETSNIWQLSQNKYDPEEYQLQDSVLYLYCPNGYGKAKLTNGFIERKLGVIATTRNWKTMHELLRIAGHVDSVSSINPS